MEDVISEATQYFADEGYQLKIERRELHAECLARGEPGRPSFFTPGAVYYCVSLERDGVMVWPDIAHGHTLETALASATHWYRR